MVRIFKISIFIVLLILVQFLKANSQNLVPNPSFEQFDTCYFFSTNCGGGVSSGKVLFWDSPTGATSDLFMLCSSAPYCDVPTNYAGYQNAHTGSAYVGEEIYLATGNNREYIQSRLDSVLKINHKYCINFYVNLSNVGALASNNIGMFFSNTHTNIGATNLSFCTPQILDTTIITDTTNWTLISGEYIALGGEQYIIIGNFNTNATTSTIAVNNSTESFYYIDDVSVWDCTGSGLGVNDASESLDLKISPNPTSGIFTVNTSGMKIKEVKVMDVVGKEIMDKKVNEGSSTIDISGIAKGVYFVRVMDEKGNVSVRRIVKE